jgi:hypothetical protein
VLARGSLLLWNTEDISASIFVSIILPHGLDAGSEDVIVAREANVIWADEMVIKCPKILNLNKQERGNEKVGSWVFAARRPEDLRTTKGREEKKKVCTGPGPR